MSKWIGIGAAVLLTGCGRTGGILALEGDPTNGAAVYNANCSTCHAESGLGSSDPDHPGTGIDLTAVAGNPDLDSEYVKAILKGGATMTPFGDILSDQDIADVLAYVHDGLIQ
jgi:mono/diheme cytochrome c family protein